MERVNLKKLWKVNNNQYPLLGTQANLAPFPFMADYIASYREFDRNFVKDRGFFQPMWNLEDEDGDISRVLSQFRSDATFVLKKHQAELERLFAINSLEYNPIENYSASEHSVDTKTGTDVLSDNFGAVESKDNFGAKENRENIGATNRTENIGAVSNSDVHGAQSKSLIKGQQENTVNNGSKNTTVAESISGFNSSAYNNANKNVTDEGATTNTSVEGQRSDSESIASYTDSHSETARENTVNENARENTYSEGAKEDVHTTNAREDSHSTEYNNTLTHDFTRSGNIGVTTSQQMIESEISLWSKWNFWDYLFELIVKELCTFSDPGYDCF